MSDKNSAWRSPWVRAWVGMILVFLSVNVVLVVLAIRTNPGLVVADYYDRGQHYEHTLFSKLALEPRWQPRIEVPADLVVGQARPVRVSIVDGAGAPLDMEDVTFYAYRPSDARYDFRLPMQQEALGRYRADVSFPLVGVWDVLVSLKRGEEDSNLGQRIAVASP